MSECIDEIKKEGLASEPMASVEPVSYAEVMNYLHTIHILREDKERVAKRLTLEVTQPALADTYEQIDHLSMLRENWDGRGALPISRRVIGNLRQVLMMSDNEDWERWMISPDVNATLCLFSPATKASISLGSREFSYFVHKDGKKQGESHVDFIPEVFLNVMRKLSA
jgi:hypothetical protein